MTSQLSTRSIKESAATKEGLAGSDGTTLPQASNYPSEGINRFLLCALVSKTAKQIKARAERTGERLPMPAIVKSVLHSYQAAANRRQDALAGSDLNQERLRSLIEDVMKEEVMRYAQEIVSGIHARLAHAGKLGDEAGIKKETEALERAIASRKRLITEFR